MGGIYPGGGYPGLYALVVAVSTTVQPDSLLVFGARYDPAVDIAGRSQASMSVVARWTGAVDLDAVSSGAVGLSGRYDSDVEV